MVTVSEHQKKTNMDSEGLPQNLDHLSSSGIILSVEKKASLQSSLVLVQQQYKFHRVKFWGIIRGIKNDYYIIHGIGRDEIRGRKALYSHDCMEWNLLPHVDEGLRVKSTRLQGRFTGDPSYIAEHKVTNRVGEGEGEEEKTTTVEMKEEDRLAAVVARIDDETAVVPRGAYIRTPLHEVILNKMFQGLTLGEAKQLNYYYHFKEPVEEDGNKTITNSIDFLDSIDQDIPKGSWSLQCDDGGAVLTLRNHKWFGLVAYHIPDTPQFGYFYSGTGEKNMDLLFML